MPATSNSSYGRLLSRMRYNLQLWRGRRGDRRDGSDRAEFRIAQLDRVVADFEHVTGRRAKDSTVVEVGFGARPERAYALTAYFGEVYAIDLEAPVLGIGDLPRTLRRNGIERAIKSAARHIFFDRHNWSGFHARMRERRPDYRPDKLNMIIGNAGDPATWAQIPPADLIYSYDVYEHIPEPDLRASVIHIRDKLVPGGMAMISPCGFAGITGGHDLKWYRNRVETNDSAGAWGHLLDPQFEPTTFLNKLLRRDFRSIFEEAGFVVEKDEAPSGDDFGRKHLSPELRAKLAAWDDYELFSNTVDFWLRHPRRAA